MAADNPIVDAGNTDRPPPHTLDSIPVVNLRHLSQSELYSLSQSSDSAFDLNRSDDVVIPKINRSVFNESAGSRKQTYSRLRLAPAESSTATKTTTVHRRTPHLRSSHPPTSNMNDPEQAENSQIIRMLKQLLKSDRNFQDIVSMEDENESIPVMPELMYPDSLPVKRKRGRPRKHENAIFLRPPAAKRIRNNWVKKVVVYDNEKDREIVNDRGVAVNMAILAGLEDPYGPDIRRRTVGMLTEDELLGFLRGLNGQWGSRRRKRRVVDASEFGDALPKGWKLSLSIKKKEGRVWLFCRRYLSPSGRQFESCKEISTYLLSVIGEENTDKPNPACINSCDDSASKGASVNAADPVLQEDIKIDSAVHNPSPPPPPPPPASPPPTNCEKQVTLDIKNELNKTKPTEEPDPNPPLMTGVPNKELPASVSTEDDVADTPDTRSDDKLKPASLQSNHKMSSGAESNTDEIVRDLNIVSNVDGNVLIQESCDKSVKNCSIDDDEIPKSNEEPETSGGTHVNCVNYKSECVLDQGTNSKSGLFSSLPNEQTGGGNRVDLAVSEPELLKSSGGEEKGFDAKMDMHVGSMSDELISEKENVVNSESSSGFFLSRFGLDKDSAPVVEKLSGKENCSLDSVKVVDSGSSGLDGQFEVGSNSFDRFGTFEEENKFRNHSSLSSWPEEECANENLENDVSIPAISETQMQVNPENSLNCRIESKESKQYESSGSFDFDTRKNVEFSSLVPSENEQAFGFQDDVTCLNQFSIAETSDDIFENKMYSSPLDGLKFDEDRDISSHELSLAFGNPHAIYQDPKKDLVNCSVVPSKIDEAFDVHTDLSMVNNSIAEDLKTGRDSGGGLFSPASGFRNGSNTVYTGGASDEFRNSRNQNFMTGFGSNHGQVRDMWKTSQENQPHSGLGHPSHAQIQSPSSFHSFDIMSEKAEDGHFSLEERYNSGFGVGGLRLGRSEPVEFSFLTGRSEHNPNTLQPDSRVFSYNPEMDQQFDSCFWLGKNTMMPNTSRNPVTSVCAWCRNEFHLPPNHSGTQDGIGPLCPACSAGISGHVNML